MKITLWRRLKIVQFLINRDASIYAKNANEHRVANFVANFERNEEERISRANDIVMILLDANKKRRQILTCLTRHEIMRRDSLNEAKLSQIHQEYFDKISSNLL